MPTFLFKTEPTEFSFDDLVAKKRATWDGVKNPAALAHLRTVRKGDHVFVYHTGDEKSIVGLARALGSPFEDPKHPGRTPAGEPKFAVVDLEPVKKAKTPVQLGAIKADLRFAKLPLVTQGRLSVMPVPDELANAIRALAGM